MEASKEVREFLRAQSSKGGKKIMTPEYAREMQRKSTEAKRRKKLGQNGNPKSS